MIMLIAVALTGCKEDDTPAGDCDGHDPLSFISLVAEDDIIEAGESTTVTATAEGYELTYEWTASTGYIFAGDSENVITYTASPCSIGDITITCEVTDACGNSETKRIIIVVQ